MLECELLIGAEATYGTFNQSAESPVLQDLMCTGAESSLTDCPGYDLVEAAEDYCSENQAGVRCVEGMPAVVSSV